MEDKATIEHPDAQSSARELVYFAAERTLLSWIRASLSLMALGFVIDRFGVVVHQLTARASGFRYGSAFSFWSGGALVVAGSLMALVAAVRYSGLAMAYRREGIKGPGHGLLLGICFTAALAIFGALLAAFLYTAVH